MCGPLLLAGIRPHGDPSQGLHPGRHLFLRLRRIGHTEFQGAIQSEGCFRFKALIGNVFQRLLQRSKRRRIHRRSGSLKEALCGQDHANNGYGHGEKDDHQDDDDLGCEAKLCVLFLLHVDREVAL